MHDCVKTKYVIIVLSMTLIVSPMFTEHPTTSCDGAIMLNCTATGFPAPTISWFHNGSLENSTLYTNIASDLYTTESILLKPVRGISDFGAYHCKASVNGNDSVDSTVAMLSSQG